MDADKPVSYQITHIKKYGTPPKRRVLVKKFL